MQAMLTSMLSIYAEQTMKVFKNLDPTIFSLLRTAPNVQVSGTGIVYTSRISPDLITIIRNVPLAEPPTRSKQDT